MSSYPSTLPSRRRSRYEAPHQEHAGPDIVVLSHLRWDFVYQRPQHLLSRFATNQRVFYLEEPIWDGSAADLTVRTVAGGVHVAQPVLPPNLPPEEIRKQQRALLDKLLQAYNIHSYVLWYYTPAALAFSDHLQPQAIVYDCMDELSLFKGASSDLPALEAELLSRADVVFTGGPSLYESKRGRHPNVHLFPSSIDFAHFAQARQASEPADQAAIARPRLGFFGVIDERFDAALIDAVAQARPDWQLVLIGPVVKIDPQQLPRRHNIHYLGARPYETLPAYLGGWDVALLPFARNDATRFISPTKTPEYLAGGKPVVSTPIRDVAQLYGDVDMVAIAGDAGAFVQAIEKFLNEGLQAHWLAATDHLLAQGSWDATWSQMDGQLQQVIARRKENK